MRRRHSQTRVIAYAMPQEKRHNMQVLWAVAAGLLTSIALYTIAALVH